MSDLRERFRKHSGTRRLAQYSCPQLGELFLQSLSELERMQIEFAKLTETGEFSFAEAAKSTARLIVASVVDQDGLRVFSDSDVDWLCELDASIAEPLREAIQQHAIPTTDVEDAKKNCEETAA